MLSDTDLAALVTVLRNHSPFVRLTDMEARTVLELMQQRGWKITPPVPAVEAGGAN